MTERWKPEFGDVYWVVTSKGYGTSCSTWHADWFDTFQFNFGNCFRTQEEAKVAAEKVKALLLDLHKNPEKTQTSPEHSQKVSRSTPDYYKRSFKDVEIQVNDITHLWNLDSDEAQAVQYILRARYKNDGNDELQDLRKAVNMLNMAIKWKERPCPGITTSL